MKLEERIIKNKLEEENSWHKKKAGFYHASQIYDICEHKLLPEDYFKKKELDEKSIFNFFIGTMYHKAIQELFPKNKQEIECKIPIGKNIQIIGRCDLNLEYPVELKTCANFPNEPYQNHIYQLNCYLHALGKKRGFLTYIKKDPQAIVTKNFEVVYDENLIKYITKKVKVFHEELLLINIKK